MRTQPITRVRQGFTLIEILIVVVILGILAAIVIPQFTDASREAATSNLQSQLQTVRSQVELYNVQNPATAYIITTPRNTFWNGLVQGNYLQNAPKNPLQNNSTTVCAAPAAGCGWIWNYDPSGSLWTLNVYSVNELGAWFDGDGDGNPD